MMPSHSDFAANADSNKSRSSKTHQRGAVSSIEWQSAVTPRMINASNVAAAVKTAAQDDDLRESRRSRTGSNRMPQPSPMLFEPTMSDNSFERRANRRDDVSTACFYVVVIHSPKSFCA